MICIYVSTCSSTSMTLIGFDYLGLVILICSRLVQVMHVMGVLYSGKTNCEVSEPLLFSFCHKVE